MSQNLYQEYLSRKSAPSTKAQNLYVGYQKRKANQLFQKINALQDKVMNLGTQYNARYFDANGQALPVKWRADSGDWLTAVEPQWKANIAEADALAEQLRGYKDYLDEDTYTKAMDAINASAESNRAIFSRAKKEHAAFAPFTNEKDYNLVSPWIGQDEATAQKTWNNLNNNLTLAYSEDNADMISEAEYALNLFADYYQGAHAGDEKPPMLLGSVGEYQQNRRIQRRDEVDAKINKLYDEYWRSDANDPMSVVSNSEYMARQNEFTKLLNPLKEERDAVNEEIRTYDASSGSQMNKYIDLTRNVDFAEKSQIVNANNPTVQEMVSFQENPTTRENVPKVDDEFEFYISMSPEDRQKVLDYSIGDTKYAEAAAVLQRGDTKKWAQVNENDIKMYRYIKATQGQKAANKYLGDLGRELADRENTKFIEDVRGASVPAKIGMAMIAAPLSFYGGAIEGFTNGIVTLLGGSPQRTDMANAGKVFNQAIMKDLSGGKEGFGWDDVYSAWQSSNESALAMLTSLAFGDRSGKLGTILMGFSAANNEMHRLYQEGASPLEVSVGGALAGFTEFMTEQLPMEQLLDNFTGGNAHNIRKMVGLWLKQAGLEGVEEGISTIANAFNDYLIRGNRSDIAKEVKVNKAKGMTDGQALWAAIKSVGAEAGEAALQGVMSGAMGGAWSSGVGLANYKAWTKGYAADAMKDVDVFHSLMDTAAELSSNATGRTKVNLDVAIAKVNESKTENNLANLVDKANLAARKVSAKALIEASGSKNPLKRLSLRNKAKSSSEAVMDMEIAGRTMAAKVARDAVKKTYTVGNGVTTNAKTGEEIRITGIYRTKENEKPTLVFRLDDGSTIRSDEVSYANDNMAVMAEALAETGIRADYAQKLLDSVTEEGNAVDAVLGMRAAIKSGSIGENYAMARKEGDAAYLTDKQFKAAYEAGQLLGKNKLNKQIGLASQKTDTDANLAQEGGKFVGSFYDGTKTPVSALKNGDGSRTLTNTLKDGTVSSDDVKNMARNNQHRKDIWDDIYYPKSKRDASAFLRSFADQTTHLQDGQRENVLVYTKDHVYLVEATGYLSGNIEQVFSLDEDDMIMIRQVTKEFKNGINERTETFDTWSETLRHDFGSDDRGYGGDENTKTEIRTHDVDGGSSGSDSLGYNWESYGYSSYDEFVEAIQSGAVILDDDGNIISADPHKTTNSVKYAKRNVVSPNAQGGQTVKTTESKKADGEPNRLSVAVDRKSLLRSTTQAQVNVLESMAKLFNVNIEIYASSVVNGERQFTDRRGRVYKGNAAYTRVGNTILVDVNAGDYLNGLMLNAVSHELVHYVREMSPEKFQKLADFVVEKFGEKGQSVTRLIRNKQAKYAAQGETLSFDEAYEEVVADSLESMLSQNADKVVSDVAELRQVDADLAKSLVSKLKDTVKKMLNIFKKEGFHSKPETEEGILFAEWTEYHDQLTRLFSEAVADAADRSAQAARRTDAKKSADNTTDEAFDGSQPMRNMLRSDFDSFEDDSELRKTHFGEQLADWRENAGRSGGSYNGQYFDLGETPASLMKHGASKAALVMYDDCLVKITGGKHDTALTEISKIPQELSDPILLFRGSVSNSFVAVTEIKTKQGHEAIVAVHINKRHGRNVINKIASLYSKVSNDGRDVLNSYVMNQIGEGNLIDVSTKKAPKWFTTRGLQLPKVVQTIIDANNSISNHEQKSQEEIEKISLAHQNTPEPSEVVKYSFRNSTNGSAHDVLRSYDAELRSIIERKGDVIVDSYDKLVDVVNQAFDNPKDKFTAYFGILPSSTIRSIEKKIPNIPRDLNGHVFKVGRDYSIAIESDNIVHLVEDKKSMTRKDVVDFLDRIADVIIEFESASFDYYVDGYGQRTKGILFKKIFFDGIMQSFDLVSGKKNSLKVQTMYLDSASYQKRKSAKTLPVQYTASAHTSKTGAGQTSSTIISNHEQKSQEGTEKKSLRNVTERQQIVSMLKTMNMEIEHNKYFKEYLEKAEKLDKKQARLDAAREEWKELAFRKGKRSEETKTHLQELRDEIVKLTKELDRTDKRLLELAELRPFRNMVANAEKRQRDKDKAKMLDHRQEVKRRAERDKVVRALKNITSYILHETKDHHIPAELRKQFADVLSSFNLDFSAGSNRQVKEYLNDLAEAIDAIKDSNSPLVEAWQDTMIQDQFKAAKEKLGRTSIYEMTQEQLDVIYQLLRTMKKRIISSNQILSDMNKENAAERVKKIVNELEQWKTKNSHKTSSFVIENLKPMQFFEFLGSDTLTGLYNNIRHGQNTYARDLMEADKFRQAVEEKYGTAGWSLSKSYTFKDAAGEEMHLTLANILSLYAHGRREQSRLHLFQHGIVLDEEIVVERDKAGKVKRFKVDDKSNHPLTQEVFTDIISTLTDEQRAYVEEMQDYLSDVMGRKGNEISLALYDMELFTEKHYWPLQTAAWWNAFNPEAGFDPKIKSPRFAMATNKHATSPIVLQGFSAVWSNHVHDMSLYHGLALPVDDFTRVVNVRTTDNPIHVGGVRQTLDDVYGKRAGQYVTQLLRDLNGGARATDDAWLTKGVSLSKKAATALSLSVAIQQPSSIMRAMAVIEMKYFGKLDNSLNVKGVYDAWEELKEYCPVAFIKEMGNMETGVGRSAAEYLQKRGFGGTSIKEILKDKNYRKQLGAKIDDIIGFLPQFMDQITWVKIWKAAQNKAQAMNPNLSAHEIKVKAAEIFDDCIDRTQVYDSPLSRSGLMRKGGAATREITAFLSEPTTTINMAYIAALDVVRGKPGAKRQLGRTMGAILGSTVLNAILKSIITAMRDDDEDETMIEKYVEHLVGNFMSDAFIFNNLPIVRDVISLCSGYDVGRMDMDQFGQLFDAIRAMTKEGITFEEVLDAVFAVTGLFGVPLKNVKREVSGIVNTVNTIAEEIQGKRTTTWTGIGSAALEGLPFAKAANKGEMLYRAYNSGDSKAIQTYRGYYNSASDANSGIKSALRKMRETEIKQAATLRYGGDVKASARIVERIARETNIPVELVQQAVMTEVEAIVKSNEPEKEDYDGGYEETASNPSKYTTADFKLAVVQGRDTEEIIESIVADKKAQKFTEKQAKNHIHNSVLPTYKDKYLDAYYAGDKAEMDRILALLVKTGLWDRSAITNIMKNYIKNEEESK